MRTQIRPPCSSLRAPAATVRQASRRHVVARGAATSALGEAEELRHITSDGLGLELQLQRSPTPSTKPPLLFVHGSYHAAWCWKEKFLPYFAWKGYDSYAVSLRGQGKSDMVDAPVAGTIESHAKDLGDLIELLPRPPVLISHSFAGLIAAKYLLSADKPGFPKLAGAGFLCSCPPSGNKSMLLRFLLKDPILSLRITWAFVGKSFTRDSAALREMFFSPDIPADELLNYMDELAAGSSVRLIDLQDVNAQTPLPPPPKEGLPPIFVLGAANDTVVDTVAVEELATYYGVKPVILPNLAHDVMLDTRWVEAAKALEQWLDKLPPLVEKK